MKTKKFFFQVLTILFFNQANIARTHFDILNNISDDQISTDCQTTKGMNNRGSKKPWTFIVYVAADNDLRPFAPRNIKQMAEIGSNKNINIVVHLDIRLNGNKKTTRRYYIERGKVLHVNANDPHSQKMDSGNPNTLVSCCKWAIEDFPADNYALILWNHGTGVIDPGRARVINTAELFCFNPEINKLELERSTGFLELIEPEDPKGVCWDDTTGNYLTNQDLSRALDLVCKKYLGGKKFGLIGFDACLMSMIEISNYIKNYAHVMVSSQEVELGTGWDYTKILKPFRKINLATPQDLGAHIVQSYASSYSNITNDYTQSALDLDAMGLLEDNVNIVAQLFLDALNNQKGKSVKNALKVSRNKLLCTHFDEPSYIDLHHFYCNTLKNLRKFTLNSATKTASTKKQLEQALGDGCKLIEGIAFANQVGSNLSKAHGISIYFPTRKIHHSYARTDFAKNNTWFNFLKKYLSR